MLDLDLISTEAMINIRDRPRVVRWAKRMKDAGKKAAVSRKQRDSARRRQRRLAALKAAATKARNKAAIVQKVAEHDQNRTATDLGED